MRGTSIVSDHADKSLRQYRSHSRHWRENLYVYPVISRRSGGLSIGINLNPDAACNFDCIYCQVNRTAPPRVREVDLAVLEEELRGLIGDAVSGTLFDDPAFADVPGDKRRICDIAFSGDGEPTTCRQFAAAVEMVARLKRAAGLTDTRIVLITDACYLTRPEVAVGLAIMDANQGDIWAKLDAGTEAYYRLVNRPNYPLQHVMDNIIATAQVRPVVIQSLFMRVHNNGPEQGEITAYVARLHDIIRAGGGIRYVQVYTIARSPAQSFVTSLSKDEVDVIVRRVRDEAQLAAEPYYGVAAD